ncbi:MAG TPA: lactonase family protein [Caldilineaceae bacterium]|nr:lactonase family protein [Caldilineaceae bacterium]
MNTTPLLYIGTYTRRGGKGIYVARFDTETGHIGEVTLAAQASNPSFLALHPSLPILYAANELAEDGTPGGGQVSAFAVDATSGALTYLNQQPTHGSAPCHLTADATASMVISTNYTSGSVAVMPIGPSGRLKPSSHVIQHEGSSVDPRRQQGPHAHSVTIDPTNSYAYVCDLGMDKVMIYQLDRENGKLIPNRAQNWARVTAGSGPRHFAFTPDQRFAYVINELDSTVNGFAFDPADGSLKDVCRLSTLPADFEGSSHCADVHVHPSGRFLYGSNRGHNSIAIYAIDETSGELTSLGAESTQGKTPRNFAIDPTGRWLLAANQDTDNIVVFAINQATGALTPTGHSATASMPVCLTFSV